MIGWNEWYNWAYDDFKRVVVTALEINDEESVYLDVEHSDAKNMSDIINWAKEKGYQAKEINCDTIKVWK